MTAPMLHAAEQAIAAFALHAAWQAPLLVLAAWVAVRVGRPRVGTAHALWLVTLLLCVAVPALSTWAGRSAAFAAEHTTVATVSYEASTYAGDLPELARAPAWQRMLNQHLRHGVEPFALVLSQRAAAIIACVWLAIALMCAVRLSLALRHTWLLVHRARTQDVSPAVHAELLRQCDALGIPAPRAAVSKSLRGPALAGTLQPTLLLPQDVAAMTAAEVEAVLAHELAHLRRGDPLLHTLCALLLVPVGFHPAAWWAAGRVRQTREIACDAEAVAHMGSPVQYARALLVVAERIAMGPARPGGLTGVGLFGGLNLLGLGVELFDKTGALEERMAMVMQESAKESRSVRAARAGGAAAVVVVAVVAAAMLQVQPALAKEQAPQSTVQAAQPEVHVAPPLVPAVHVAAPVVQAPQPHVDVKAMAKLNIDHAPADAQLAAPSHAQIEVQVKKSQVEIVRTAAIQQAQAAAVAQIKAAKLTNAEQVRVAVEAARADLIQRTAARVKAEALQTVARIEMPAPKAAPAFASPAQTGPQDPDKPIKVTLAYGDLKVRSQPNGRIDPDETQVKHISGAVVFHVIIDKEGNIESMQVVSSPDESLSRAAWARMKQTTWWPYLLNGKPQAIETTMTFNFHATDATPPDADRAANISGGVMAGNKIGGPTPHYPQDAKDQHISGAVVIQAIIDKTGHVEATQIVSSPNDSLSKAAIEAVRNWTYRPYMLNGNPTSVDTTITVNFSFGG